MRTFLLLLLLVYLPRNVHGYVPPEIRQRWKTGYDKEQAIRTIEECAQEGEQNDDLYCAVKYLDRFAAQHWAGSQTKKELMDQVAGSWELRLALNSDKDRDFYPHPEFRSFAMAFITVDENYFGKGIAPNPSFCFVALGGPSTQNVDRRQVFMEYEDYYIYGRTVPGWDLSYYMKGYQRNWVAADRKRPPLSFTVILATDRVLCLRGSKTGGMAIFRRISEDMRPAAYGMSP